MAALVDPIRLAAYKDALCNWRVSGYVDFDLTDTAYNWLRGNFGNITLLEIKRLMHAFVMKGGVINEVQERRSNWTMHEYHYDLRFLIRNKPVYIETRLFYREPLVLDESTILIVNIHSP